MKLIERFNEVLQCDASDDAPLATVGCTYGEARTVAAWALATRQAAVGLPEKWEPIHRFIDEHLAYHKPEVATLLSLLDYPTPPAYHRLVGTFMVGDFIQVRTVLVTLVSGVPQMARTHSYYRPRDVIREIQNVFDANYWEQI